MDGADIARVRPPGIGSMGAGVGVCVFVRIVDNFLQLVDDGDIGALFHSRPLSLLGAWNVAMLGWVEIFCCGIGGIHILDARVRLKVKVAENAAASILYLHELARSTFVLRRHGVPFLEVGFWA